MESWIVYFMIATSFCFVCLAGWYCLAVCSEPLKKDRYARLTESIVE